MRLWHYQTLIVNAIVLVGFLAYGSYIAWEQGERTRTEIAMDANNLAQSIAAGSINDILTDSLDRIENRLLRQVTISSTTELLVASVDGQVLVNVRRQPDGTAQAVYDERAVHVAAAPGRFTDYSYTQTIPIEQSDILGYVRITADLTRLNELMHRIWLDTFEICALVILLLGTIQMLLLRRIGRALQTSSQFAETLISHHGSTIDPHSRILEIRELKHALNRVSQSLSLEHRALTESEARKRAMMEASLDCLIIIDSDGRVVELNKAAEDTFGYQRDQVLGLEMVQLIVPPVHRKAHIAGMRHYLATGEGPVLNKRLELSAVRKSGEEFPIELSIAPFVTSGEKYFLGAMRDITELKTAESEKQRADTLLKSTLRELEARQRALDKHAIVSVTDLQGDIIYVNQKFCAVSGYERDELMGRNHRLIKSGKHSPKFYESLWSTIAQGDTWQGEIANRRKDGSIYWVMSTIVPVLGSDGLPQQYISIRTDITEQKNSALELAEARSREVAVGHEIQQTLLLTPIPPQFGPVSIATYNEPSSGIDGDFTDFIPHAKKGFDLVIGDVMGKGIPAALIGAGVKKELNRVLAAQSMLAISAGDPLSPAALINLLHRRLFPSLYELDCFVTLSLLHFDPTAHRITYVDAGHTKTILVGRMGTRMLAGENVPLGVLAEEAYVQQQAEWSPGELLLMYSDGLTEATDAAGEMFGVDRLAMIVEQMYREQVPATVAVQAVRQQVNSFTRSGALHDDATCIAVQFDHSDVCGGVPMHFDLNWQLEELQRLRGEIGRLAHTAGLAEEAANSLVLAVSETATNIIRHVPRSHPNAVIHCRADHTERGLDVIFYYLGEAFTPADIEPDFSGASDGGFGLYIVRSSVDEVSYDDLGYGVQRIYLSKRHHGGSAPRQP